VSNQLKTIITLPLIPSEHKAEQVTQPASKDIYLLLGEDKYLCPSEITP
jgi:hypothetical protein